MKKRIYWTIFGLFGVVFIFGCQPPKEESQAYLQLLAQHTANIQGLYEPLQAAANDTPIDKIETERQALNKELDKQIYAIKEVKHFDGGTKYRDKVLHFLLEMLSIVEHESKELSELLQKRADGEALTEKEQKRLLRLPKMIAAKYRVARQHYEQALDDFVNEYGVKPL